MDEVVAEVPLEVEEASAIEVVEGVVEEEVVEEAASALGEEGVEEEVEILTLQDLEGLGGVDRNPAIWSCGVGIVFVGLVKIYALLDIPSSNTPFC